MATVAINGTANGGSSTTPVASDAVEVSSSRFSNGERKGIISNSNTPHSTAADGGKKPRNATSNPNFGGPTLVRTSGSFPALGATLGPYFSVGKLGKGTFCSIHKCINMHYHHDDVGDLPYITKGKPKVRLAAAKMEVGEFKNSGVLGGEATMLQFLDAALEPLTVPVYMGHLRGNDEVSAIVMEYLPGQDMHWIRDWATKHKSRRISVEDAVYLTADVMLPLLQRMHEVGIVHRDVKPSNCVKRGIKDFCMVDFGLSKSIIVPSDSSVADTDRPWTGKDWIRPPNHSGSSANFRKERETAEFRGTSMYASVRVHQLKDYCPRDDMWSLLYVFCDLVTGGLPWMSHAANRDRESCQKLKERIHGEEEGTPDQTERLLFGYEYHTELFRKFKGGINPPDGVEEESLDLPDKLTMSKDERKVDLLRKAFAHLATLGFSDTPDYKLINECLIGFLDGDTNNDSIPPIDWDDLDKTTRKVPSSKPFMGDQIPNWDLGDLEDPVDGSLFQEAEEIARGEPAVELHGEEADLARLPIELRYRIAQMEYNAKNNLTIRPHLALRDWMKAALSLAYGVWDTKAFERGGHRNKDDPYRKELYLKLINKCLDCAGKFQNFRSRDCFYEDVADKNGNLPKKRKISTSIPGRESGNWDALNFVAVSQVFVRLRAEQARELDKPRAPPPRLSFG